MVNDKHAQDDDTQPRMHASARAAIALLAALFFCWCAWAALSAGASRMISDFAVRSGVPAAADASVALTPGDAEALYARAGLFADAGDYARAESAYMEAIALRPRDYVLWVELGKARDQKGDAEGALDGFKEATRLAPFYAQPRWQLGNALLRAGRREEAAEELRRAAASDPHLYPNLIQALWYAGGRDPRALVVDARPQTPEQTLSVVKFLIKAGAAGEGMKTLRDSGAELSADARRSLVADLLAAYDFAGAYEVWSEGRGVGLGALSDGGFEAEARTDEVGFGWQFAKNVPTLKFSLDPDSPREGRRSLKVEYAGNSEPATPAVSQLILVEQGARYRLTFAARSKELVTGGPPFVQITSAGKGGEVLASAAPLSPGMTAWQDFSVEFNAPQTTSGAVRVALLRQPCTSSPCPAFGSVWLDAFTLRRL